MLYQILIKIALLTPKKKQVDASADPKVKRTKLTVDPTAQTDPAMSADPTAQQTEPAMSADPTAQ